MPYDPSMPATIDNEFPRKDWPIKYGKKVVFINPKSSRFPYMSDGLIHFYNPSTHDTCVTSKGLSFFSIKMKNRKSSSFTVSEKDVFPDTIKGNKQCKNRLAEIFREMSVSNTSHAKRLIQESEELNAMAIELERDF